MSKDFWLPDWGKMDRRQVTLFERDEKNELVNIDWVEVSVEENNTYRLLEQPLFDDKYCWGELFEGRFISDEELEYIQLIETSKHTRASGLLSKPINYDKALKETGKISNFDLSQDKRLQKIMDDGGFWQQDMGGLLSIFYPPGKSEKDY